MDESTLGMQVCQGGGGEHISESTSRREMRGIMDVGALMREIWSWGCEHVKEEGRGKECQAGIGELTMENMLMRKVENSGDASMLRRKKEECVSCSRRACQGECVDEESGEHVEEEEEESSGRSRRAHR